MLTKEQVVEIQNRLDMHSTYSLAEIAYVFNTLLAALDVVEAARKMIEVQYKTGIEEVPSEHWDKLIEALKPFERKQGE